MCCRELYYTFYILLDSHNGGLKSRSSPTDACLFAIWSSSIVSRVSTRDFPFRVKW